MVRLHIVILFFCIVSCSPYFRLKKITAFSCETTKKLNGLYMGKRKNNGYTPYLYMYESGICTSLNRNISDSSISKIENKEIDTSIFEFTEYSDWGVYMIKNDSITIQWVTFWSSPIFGEVITKTGKFIDGKIIFYGRENNSKSTTINSFYRINLSYIPDSSSCPYIRPKYQKRLRKIHCERKGNI